MGTSHDKKIIIWPNSDMDFQVDGKFSPYLISVDISLFAGKPASAELLVGTLRTLADYIENYNKPKDDTST